MKVVRTLAGLQTAIAQVAPRQKIGFVPTMGALHRGHGSLIQRARVETDFVVVSIFVNPLQFGANEDLDHYPRQWEGDRQFCDDLGVDLIFAPTVAEMYPGPEPVQILPPPGLTSGLCGRFRPGHFTGMATVVVKLLQLVRPAIAYFGEKDAQQLAIIKRLVQDLHLPVTVRGCPIVREPSGLALSSRNQYLSTAEKAEAIALSQALQTAQALFQTGERHAGRLIAAAKETLAKFPGVQLQYLELVDPETLTPLPQVQKSGLLAIAAYVGQTRLIDNTMLKTRQPIIAIDGPAGAGKSTVTRQVAEQLKLLFLDTGAMYRAIAYLVLENNINPQDEVAVAELVSTATITLVPPKAPTEPITVLANNLDVTQAIRTPTVTKHVSVIAAQAAVRQALVKQQQRLGENGGLVAEGRDIGTHVFPDAELKIFLTATPAERARRRAKDLASQGETNIDLGQLEAEITERDRLDSTRAIAPLTKAPDAVELITDNLSIEAVVAKIIHLYKGINQA
ncbi:bifunctional pantoate--beta-alanine ligase/(d)CMP kinase [Picosynechococcus sp. PCC 7117]|uniref:bifunctional pantoate--beta-alanine ligase/(d)CMP kinase n=1 Tax=Picosynechococcus sp. PCC 7117 TaxID=195498 RepID=UPI000810A962|nr:bifunctional pantoate--beta-alanine ligase/(d)CMP kinase [Picosynechococcus sp. PCC 7117]ANV86305.1 cytidylate kinase [Picosynechococcus sp. PCC 7117]